MKSGVRRYWGCALFGTVAISAAASVPAIAVEPGASVEMSWEQIEIPGVSIGVVKNTFAAGGGTVSRIESDDGEFHDGRRVDIAFGGPAFFVGGQQFNLGVKGFNSWRDANSSSQKCSTPVGGPICTVMPLIDSNTTGGFPSGFNTPFDQPGDTISFTTARDIDHWGTAIELEMPVINSGGAPGFSLSLKGGPAYRTLDSDLTFAAIGVRAGLPAGVVTYNEKLDTDYWGAYFGATGRINIGGGLSLVADGEFGVYRADTDYGGAYAASGTTGSGRAAIGGKADVSQVLALNREETAYISAVKLMLEQDFGPIRFGAFARGEFYSYAPQMNYNDNDRTGGINEDLVGPNNGTSIGDDDAWTFSAGGRITVDMN